MEMPYSVHFGQVAQQAICITISISPGCPHRFLVAPGKQNPLISHPGYVSKLTLSELKTMVKINSSIHDVVII